MNDFKYGHCLKQIIDIWSNGYVRTRGYHVLDNSCNFLLRWGDKLNGIFDSFNLGIQEGIVYFHSIYTLQCVLKVGSTLNGVERSKQRCRI